MCRIRLAVDRKFSNKQTGEREADFFNVTCWRQSAEFAQRYLHKGSMVIVDGSIQNDNYTDQNGTKHYGMQVIADSISFGESRRAAQENGGGYQNAYNAPSGPPSYGNGQPSYNANPAAPPAPAPPAGNSVQLGDLGAFEEILSDGEVPF